MNRAEIRLLVVAEMQ